jgi:leader peptidase (prepilin peptidase)/N-methyltransferase
MTAVRILIALPLGLAFGSFLTVVVHRVPRRESIVRPGSRCPSCGTQIRARDNIPVVSYLLLRGRCRHCGVRISPVYLLTELATGALFVAAALEFDRVLVAAMMAPFLGLLVAIAVIDARHRVVPNRLVYPGLLLGALLVLLGAVLHEGVDLARSAIGFLAYGGGLLVVALLVPRGMGMGDVKLAALIGLCLGALGLSYVAVAAAAGILAGGVGAVGAMAFAGCGRRATLPFGPFLAVGAVVAAFAGAEVAQAYLRLMS